MTLVNFINLLYSLLAFFALYLFLRPERFSPMMLLVFPGLVIIFVFALGMANLTSVINLNIRDFQPLQSLLLQGVFYATPIIFQADVLKNKGWSIVYEVNPFYYLLEVVRAPMLGKTLPDARTYIIAAGVAILVFIVGVVVVTNASKTLAYRL
jgi:ABC-type polysaccharide/polyol phosphate export permease